MSHNETCRRCGKELKGALELKAFSFGPRLVVVLQATPDCNWLRCIRCGRPVCKGCVISLRSRLNPKRCVCGPDREQASQTASAGENKVLIFDRSIFRNGASFHSESHINTDEGASESPIDNTGEGKGGPRQ